MVLLSHSYFIYLSSFCCTKTKTQKNLLDPLDMKTHYIYNIAFYLCCTASYFSTLCSNAHITLPLHYTLRNVGDGIFFPQAQYKNLLIQAEMMELRTRVRVL